MHAIIFYPLRSYQKQKIYMFILLPICFPPSRSHFFPKICKCHPLFIMSTLVYVKRPNEISYMIVYLKTTPFRASVRLFERQYTHYIRIRGAFIIGNIDRRDCILVDNFPYAPRMNTITSLCYLRGRRSRKSSVRT